MKTEFSTLEIVKALGIPRERLRDWMNRGFIIDEATRRAVVVAGDLIGNVIQPKAKSSM